MDSSKLRVVTIRLLRQDVANVKKIADRLGVSYQAWVRQRVHEAIEQKKTEMKGRPAIIR